MEIGGYLLNGIVGDLSKCPAIIEVRRQVVDITEDIVELAIQKVIEAMVVKEICNRRIDAAVGFLPRSREEVAETPDMIAEREALTVGIERAERANP